MLEPRQTDLPALFLVLVVLPMVAYVLLGKWSETSKKKEKISLLAQLAAEEALRAETMAAAAAAAATAATTVIPLAPVVKNTVHECARCYAPATTRCSQCKSVRYCSGKCQIIHWRLGHKQECQQLENTIYASSPRPSSASGPMDGRFSHAENTDLQFSRYNNQSWHENSHSDSAIHSPVNKVDSFTVTPAEKRKPNKEALKREDGVTSECSEEPSKNGSSREAHKRHKQKNPKKDISPTEITVDPGNSCGTNVVDIGKGLPSEENLGFASKDETEEVKDHSEKVSSKRGHKDKNGSHVGTKMYKSPKSTTKASREPLCSDTQRKGQIEEVARVGNTIPLQGNGGVASMGIMKMIGLMKSSKHDKKEPSEVDKGRHKKIKMLFPYEEFVKLFQYEVFDLIPRGLINCGNSCYANAVLQCLTCTKPLTIYLLRRSHSRACSGKDWCLMCELEQHVMMMRESEGPLSLSRMLLQMRSINCQIGDGSQEDAHEFLRILVTSMQSICLEGLGGEDAVGPKLQETTFIQHIFRGRLRSKVKCLKCRHESARYENIMDLTLEIYGWVESLEDALTQFTSPEDLDGENMYRCGRCAAYVRAQKQLSIQEAPNILTIVLKRFQEGSYGKINKCISFPEMLDMIPFMTGTDDIPPLYMLYAVVVHLDTLNASFSGHYISYVKDLQGNWFRIDDTEVQLVTVNHVMSEGAYILFYARSSPRLTRTYTGKPARPQPPPSVSKHWTSKTQKSSTQEQINHTCNFSDNRIPRTIDFSDVASSDWSIFTSSDDASFTTESTRDSFSTVDYADPVDPISSIFNGSYPPVYSRFGSEGKNCGVYAKNEGGQQDGPLRNSGFCKF